ncbi:MAG: type II toxin-antitoxin system VapC family toxin [Oceanipulchritudo sp.]
MSWLLDTCALSEKLQRHPDPKFVRWIEARDPGEMFISVISIGEIEKGIQLLADSAKKKKLARWFANELIPFFKDRTLEIGPAEAREWGRIFARLQLQGKKPPVIDSLLAAMAATHGLTLVTRNEADFLLLGVEVLNPWTPS